MALVTEVQQIIASGMPLALIIGFIAIALVRRRDRRRGDSDEA